MTRDIVCDPKAGAEGGRRGSVGHLLCAGMALAALLPHVALATNRAVIVGVSQYDNLPEARQLRGPYNDARRVRETLLRQDFRREDVVVLANCPRGSSAACDERFPPPTLAGIRNAFEQLIGRTARGDYIYLHLAGHGSQEPVPSGSGRTDEPDDGLDEIFLPSDAGHWNGRAGAVANALADNEINAYVTRLRNAGAFVWAVFDTCHSGTLIRAAQDESEQDRFLDPVADLGIPRELIRTLAGLAGSGGSGTSGALEAATPLRPDAAGYVALYASQPDERTPELGLPAGQSPRQIHGLFTFTLMQVLDTYPQLTYQQVVERVLARYESLNRSRPVPMFEGTDPEGPVFGRTGKPGKQQWPLSRRGQELVFPAGTVHEIMADSTLLVVPEAAAADASALGVVEVTRSGLTESAVRPIAAADWPVLNVDSLPRSAYVRVHQRSYRLRLRVATPPAATMARPELAGLERVIARLRTEDRLLLDWVRAGEPADVHLHVDQRRRVWLLPASGELEQQDTGRPSSIAIPTDAPEATLRHELLASLSAIARAVNLLRVAQDDQLSQDLIDARLWVVRSNGRALEPVANLPRVSLREGDRVRLEVRNTSERPVDVTMLFLDGRYGITPLFPSDSQSDNRIGPGATHRLNATVSGDTAGVERLIIIAAAADRDTRTDFLFLAQDPLTADRLVGKRAALSPVEKLLAAAGFQGGTTRGLEPEAACRLAIRVLTWRTAGTSASSYLENPP